MKKILMTVLVLGVAVFTLTACGKIKELFGGEEEVTYQTILDEYSQKLRDAAPKAVEEYKQESAGITGDIMALAEIANRKIMDLAEIETEGVGKMAELQVKNQEDYAVYEGWATQLYNVYMECGMQVSDAYMESAGEALPIPQLQQTP